MDQGVGSWILFQNNAVTMPQHPYSPDMAPCDFIFPKVNKNLKGRRIAERGKGYPKNRVCEEFRRLEKALA